jgi:hypothetical protein
LSSSAELTIAAGVHRLVIELASGPVGDPLKNRRARDNTNGDRITVYLLPKTYLPILPILPTPLLFLRRRP